MAGIFTPALAARSLLALSLLFAGVASAAESVQALRYGVSLYYLYQGDYFESLTELMVGQELAQLGPHQDNAELLRGGVSLSYGMDREAEQIFQALLSEPREGVDRDRAWFYLAKVAWQRGELDRASAALAQLRQLQQPALVHEANYLRASIALRRGDMQAANAAAQAIPLDSPWYFYTAYNMGATAAADQQWQSASDYFRSFADEDLYSEELKSLRDRAYTASGYAQMAAADYAGAQADFTQVRLTSPMSDRALLGYGWASIETEDYLAALSPWQVLSEKPPVSQSVRESLLAIPYAYEQLGRDGLALHNYQDAAAALEAELDAVRAAIELFQASDLQSLLQLEVEGSDEWLFGDDILPLSDQAPYLRHLIASHEFQSAMKEMRDLQRIDLHLSRSAQRLQVLGEADDEQQLRWRSVIEEGGRDALEQRYQQLLVQLDAVEQKIASAEKQDDGRAFADAERRQQWQRVERAQQLSAALDKPQQQEMLRLYRGLLIWDDSENYTEKRWQAQRELAQLQGLAEQSQQGLAALDQTIGRRRESGFAPRIAVMGTRIDAQLATVDVALAESEQGLRQVAVAELEAQAQQLSRSLGQSRLAIARLYDRGSVGVSP
ncbi:MAG: hypothetical protein ABJ308_05730 [Halieaceae bacterium]